MRQPTPAQQWARKRNWAKRMLLGSRPHLHSEILTKKETKLLNQAHALLNEVIYNWEYNNAESKEIYLKRKEKS